MDNKRKGNGRKRKEKNKRKESDSTKKRNMGPEGTPVVLARRTSSPSQLGFQPPHVFGRSPPTTIATARIGDAAPDPLLAALIFQWTDAARQYTIRRGDRAGASKDMK